MVVVCESSQKIDRSELWFRWDSRSIDLSGEKSQGLCRTIAVTNTKRRPEGSKGSDVTKLTNF